MPAPMPPQQSAPGPGGPPPQMGPPGQDGGQQQPGAASGLLQTLDKAIDHVNTMVQQSKALNPQQKQMFNTIDQLFEKFMESMGDADQDQGGGGQGQTVPPEAGGNKGAIPSPM